MPFNQNKTIIVDFGASSMKYGYAEDQDPKVIPNVVGRTSPDKKIWISDMINECNNYSTMYFKSPFEKGYLIHWDIQVEILDRLFSHNLDNCNPLESNIMVAEPFMNWNNIQDAYEEILFEEYNFQGLIRTSSLTLSNYRYQQLMLNQYQQSPDCSLMINSGYSHTHIVPYYKGEPLTHAAKRLNIGGKVLTNYLKELISFRHFNMMDETFVINELKEQVAFFSSNFNEDCKKSRDMKQSPYTIDYLLPDFFKRKHGIIKTGDIEQVLEDQVIKLNTERFMVPEVLFTPSIVGFSQAGLSEGIIECLKSVDEELVPLFVSNIFLTGGNAKMDRMEARIFNDLRPNLPEWYQINVEKEKNPQLSSWYGAQSIYQDESTFKEMLVTKRDYEELGHHVCRRRFKI